MRKALFILALLAAGSWLAHYHVSNQHYFPVASIGSPDGLVYTAVQDMVLERGACGAANDRFLAPMKRNCPACKVLYARCEREIAGLELALLTEDFVPHHVVTAAGIRIAVAGKPEQERAACEQIVTDAVRNGLRSAACVFPKAMKVGEPPAK